MLSRMGCLGLAAMAFSTVAWADDGGEKRTVSIYDFTMDSIDGKPVKLSAYKGQALMIVNVASK